MNTSVVVSVTPESSPPNTPAIHIGFSVSQIIRSLSESLRSTPSKVTNGVPSGHVRTITLPPLILPASNACNGWPTSCRMKFVMSTMLLCGFSPIERSRFWSHSGDSATLTPVTVIPIYRGAASVLSTSTATSLSEIPSRNAETSGSTSRWGMPFACRYTARSRATP